LAGVQEISEIIAGRISTQDEEEVEDELAALEAEAAAETAVKNNGTAQKLPSVPDRPLPAHAIAEPEAEGEGGRTAQPERQAMLA